MEGFDFHATRHSNTLFVFVSMCLFVVVVDGAGGELTPHCLKCTFFMSVIRGAICSTLCILHSTLIIFNHLLCIDLCFFVDHFDLCLKPKQSNKTRTLLLYNIFNKHIQDCKGFEIKPKAAHRICLAQKENLRARSFGPILE